MHKNSKDTFEHFHVRTPRTSYGPPRTSLGRPWGLLGPLPSRSHAGPGQELQLPVVRCWPDPPRAPPRVLAGALAGPAGRHEPWACAALSPRPVVGLATSRLGVASCAWARLPHLASASRWPELSDGLQLGNPGFPAPSKARGQSRRESLPGNIAEHSRFVRLDLVGGLAWLWAGFGLSVSSDLGWIWVGFGLI